MQQTILKQLQKTLFFHIWTGAIKMQRSVSNALKTLLQTHVEKLKSVSGKRTWRYAPHASYHNAYR